MSRIYSLIISFLLVIQVQAQNLNYYNSINVNATGATLENALSSLISSTHTNTISYSTAYQLIKDANEDPNNNSNVILIYSGLSDAKSNSYGGGGTGTAATGWTREHIFPKSLASPNLGTSGPGADAHNLAPCRNSINGARGNKLFESGSGTYGSVSSTGWYPGDDWRGDVARAVFYMNVRYGSQCEISDVSTLSLLLQWNAIDPVSSIEDQRNDEIALIQGNRNPFIDNPIFATRIWGGPTAQDRFSSALADPLSFVLASSSSTVSFTATANGNGDNVVLAFTNANGSFGVPSGSYSAGNSISGGGTVLYVGSAGSIPDHQGLNAGTIYKYKIWSLDGSLNYSNGIESSISTDGGAVQLLYRNSFESAPEDNWSYTPNPNTYNTSGDIWAVQSSNGSINAGSDGSNFWAIRDLNNPNGGGSFFHVLDFQTLDISQSQNVELSFDYYAEAFESTDKLEYELFYDGQSQGQVSIFQGGTGGLSSNGWTTVSVSIPDNVNQLQLHLRAIQDGGSDYGGFDNISLEASISTPGLSLQAYSPTAVQPQLTANSSNDSILLVYGSGLNLVFSNPNGLYQVGQAFQGIGFVAYFGPAGNVSPITRLTEGGDYTFAAFSFDGNSYSAAVSQNISLPNAEGSANGLQFFQGFESSANDTWTISSGSGNISSNQGSSDYPPNERVLSGTNSWQVNDASQSLELQSVDCSSADSVTLEINLSSTALTAGNGADGADFIKVYLNIDNAGFPAQPDITINGNNNAKWGYGTYSTSSGSLNSSGTISSGAGQNLSFAPSSGGYQESEAYHKILIGINNINQLALRIEVQNNSGNEIWSIDDIALNFTSNALVWNGSEWKNNQAPDQNTAGKDLIIYPGEDAELYTEVEVRSLDLRQNSRLIVTSSASLETSTITSSDGELVLEADNSGSASYLGPSIQLRKEYYISRSGWHALAFPFSNVTFRDLEFSNGGFINYAATAGVSTCSTCNLYYYDAGITNASNIGAQGTSAYGTWIAIHDSTASVNPLIGYYLFLGPPYFGQIPMVLSVEGTSLSGTQQISTEDGNGGWNLLANPFPSALNWDNKLDLSSQGFDQSYWVYNGSTFATYNGGVGVNGANGYIPSGQAFFVHSASPIIGSGRNTRNFGVQTGMRNRNNSLRHKTNSAEIIRLSAILDSSFSNEIALAFSETATDQYTSEEDALMAGDWNSRSFVFKYPGTLGMVIRKDSLLSAFEIYPLGIGEDLRNKGELQLTEAPEYYYYYLTDDTHETQALSIGQSYSLMSYDPNVSLVVSEFPITKAAFAGAYWTLEEGQINVYSIREWQEIRVYDSFGREVFAGKDYHTKYRLPLAPSNGLFIVKVYFPNGIETLKVIR